ncbi:MAG: DUF305 domain-containing protein [Nanoarchaeota archaeon]|nr:DUF305 domain-containing protein [Nanoarchaeota archaeon]
MNKNIIIIITTVAIVLSIIAIIIAGFSIMTHHNMIGGNYMGGVHNSMHTNNMIHSNQMDHSMMMHEVSSELEFIIEMIPHHQEAVDSSRQLLQLGTNNEELKILLNEVIVAQEGEISMMQMWLESWYSDEVYESNYMQMMPDLTQLQGTNRDNAYLMGMIMHHQMAIIMAQSVLEIEDVRDEVKELAQEIIRVQEEEITLMNSLLE